MAAELSPEKLSEIHRPTLDQALDAIRTRAYWSPHPEHPKAYGTEGLMRQPRRGRGQSRVRRRAQHPAGSRPARHRRMDRR